MQAEKMNARARGELQRILDLAVEERVDEILFEWASGGGLEVTWMCGNSGIGQVIEDTKLGEEVLGLIVDGAELERKISGNLHWKVQGEERAFKVETYDNFGERAFRLRPAGKKRRETKHI
jgi:hypothetical protein